MTRSSQVAAGLGVALAFAAVALLVWAGRSTPDETSADRQEPALARSTQAAATPTSSVPPVSSASASSEQAGTHSPDSPASAAGQQASSSSSAGFSAPPLPTGGVEPEAEVIQRLDRLTEAGDAAGLLALFRQDRSMVRFEALRRFMEAGGLDSLPPLVEVLTQEEDPRVHALVGEALAAGGRTQEAARLAAALPGLKSPSARLGAAGAVVSVAARAEVSAEDLGRAVLALEDVATEAPGLARPATQGLALGGDEGVRALERIAADAEQPDATRFAAAESLHRLHPGSADWAFEALANGADDPHVRNLSRLYLDR